MVKSIKAAVPRQKDMSRRFFYVYLGKQTTAFNNLALGIELDDSSFRLFHAVTERQHPAALTGKFQPIFVVPVHSTSHKHDPFAALTRKYDSV
jgi:hypothetical protein